MLTPICVVDALLLTLKLMLSTTNCVAHKINRKSENKPVDNLFCYWVKNSHELGYLPGVNRPTFVADFGGFET